MSEDALALTSPLTNEAIASDAISEYALSFTSPLIEVIASNDPPPDPEQIAQRS